MPVSLLPPWIVIFLRAPNPPQALLDRSFAPFPLPGILLLTRVALSGPHWPVTAFDVGPGLSIAEHRFYPRIFVAYST